MGKCLLRAFALYLFLMWEIGHTIKHYAVVPEDMSEEERQNLRCGKWLSVDGSQSVHLTSFTM